MGPTPVLQGGCIEFVMSDIPRDSPPVSRGMEKPAPMWKVVVGGLIYVLLTFGPFLLARPLELVVTAMGISVLASPFVGPYVIWRLVRWLNRRDDPRRAKLPPDSP
jgi:hypothetical protein